MKNWFLSFYCVRYFLFLPFFPSRQLLFLFLYTYLQVPVENYDQNHLSPSLFLFPLRLAAASIAGPVCCMSPSQPAQQHWVMTYMHNLTEHFFTLEEVCDYKRRSANFKALNLWNIRSGIARPGLTQHAWSSPWFNPSESKIQRVKQMLTEFSSNLIKTGSKARAYVSLCMLRVCWHEQPNQFFRFGLILIMIDISLLICEW